MSASQIEAKEDQRAQIVIPINKNLSKHVWIRGFTNYNISRQTTNAGMIFLPSPISSRRKTKVAFGSTDYFEKLNVERLYSFMGYDTWYSNIVEVPFIEFSRLSLFDDSESSEEMNDQAVENVDNVKNVENVMVDDLVEDEYLNDDDEWMDDDVDDESSVIEIVPVNVEASVAEQVKEMRAEQEKIRFRKLIQPKQLLSTNFSGTYYPPGRIFQSVCIDERNNNVYVYGGFSGNRSPCSLITRFSIEGNELKVEDLTDSFQLVEATEAKDKLGKTPFREGHTAVIRKGKMYVLAGNAQRTGTFEKELLEFDLEKGNIKPYQTICLGKSFTPRAYHSATYIEKRDVMCVYGGKMKPGLQSGVSNELFLFHFQTHTWENIELRDFIFPPLSGHYIFKINNDNIGIIGGVSKPYSEEKEDLNSNLFVYNLEYNSFSAIDLGPYGFNGRYSMPAAFSASNQLLAIGAGNTSYREGDFTVIYFETVETNSEHFVKPLLLNSFDDVSIICQTME